MDASSSSLLPPCFSQRFSGVFFFLVIKKIIIPELMGALLKFFEIDLCISQLAAIVNAVGPPPPFCGTPSVCAATQHSVLLMFLRDFSASCPTQKQLVACNRRRIWLCLCGPVSKSAPENKFMIYRKHMLRSLSIHPSLSPSLSLSPTTGNASLLQSFACCCYCYCCMLFSKCIICAISFSWNFPL